MKTLTKIMKNYLLGILFCTTLIANAQVDDIESYPTGPLFNNTWTTWSGNDNGTENAIVTTDLAKSGTKSIALENQGQDALYSHGETATSGTWNAQWYMYVPSGHSAFFNLQGKLNPNERVYLSYDFYFNSGNNNPGIVKGYRFSETVMVEADFPHDEWFKMGAVVNIDNINKENSTYKIYINDALILDETELEHVALERPVDRINGFDGINFYANDSFSKSYIDDVDFSKGDILSTSNFKKTNFSFYPNPVKEVLHINSKNDIIKSIAIYDLSGKLVTEKKFNSISPSINISTLNPGLYLVDLQANNGSSQTLKIIK